MSMTNPINARRYHFGPLEKKGLLAGLRTGQLLSVAGGALLAVLSMKVATGGAFFFIIFFLGAGLAGAFLQPGGRGVDEWVPVLMRWSMTKFGGAKWVSTAPLLGHDEVRTPQPEDGKKKGTRKIKGGSLPPTLRSVIMLEAPVDEFSSTVGILKDRQSGTYTAVLAVRGTAFALLDNSEKERRLAAWADVLGGLAHSGGITHRVQWIERSVPDDGDGLNRYLSEAKSAGAADHMVRSYVDLLEEYGPSAQQHETYIALQIHPGRGASKAVKKAGGGDDGACAVLVRELRQLSYKLTEADIVVNGVLTPRLLSQVLRVSIDPQANRMIARRGRLNNGERGVAPESAWPMATEEGWSHYRTENAFHRTYWISEWPRVEVGTDFMAPLILRSSRFRTVSLTMEPVDPTKAVRDVESKQTQYRADEQLRTRAGYISSKRRQQEMESMARREEELAVGYADFRYSGYVTVTGTTLDELEDACSDVEQAAQQARVELRPLYGEQAMGFTCTLPLGRGLRK